MRPDDKRALREKLLELLTAYDPGSADEKITQEARTLYATHKGQIAMLDEDLAKAIQVLETIGYSNQSIPLERLEEALEALEKASR